MTEPKNEPKKPAISVTEEPPTDPSDDELSEDDLASVSGGLRATDPVVTKPPVCISRLE